MLFNSLAVASLAGLASAGTVATSNVKGKAFDRMAIIYFENENYAKSIGDGTHTHCKHADASKY